MPYIQDVISLEAQWAFGRFLGYLLIFVVIPYVCFSTAQGAMRILFGTNPPKRSRPKKKPPVVRTEGATTTSGRKRKTKRDYPVIEGYGDEHKITHPFASED